MVPPIVKRYLLAVNRYKWIIPAGVAVGLGAGGVVAIQPEPPLSYVASSKLVSNAPPITFSTIGSQVRQPVETFTEDTLLTDQVVDAIAQEVGIKPDAIRKGTSIKIEGGGGDPKAPTSPKAEVNIAYKDGDQKRAGEVISQLSRRFVEQ
ncbi:lipopolysaccharide biosynthesis, partial [Pseudanabaenaceae cyanobacterium LEGE 13415]|nr:lipopolysaccharide biosynthesis [Pseudanabaenaceae cyanobacterium LEGE 13415]